MESIARDLFVCFLNLKDSYLSYLLEKINFFYNEIGDNRFSASESIKKFIIREETVMMESVISREQILLILFNSFIGNLSITSTLLISIINVRLIGKFQGTISTWKIKLPKK